MHGPNWGTFTGTRSPGVFLYQDNKGKLSLSLTNRFHPGLPDTTTCNISTAQRRGITTENGHFGGQKGKERPRQGELSREGS